VNPLPTLELDASDSIRVSAVLTGVGLSAAPKIGVVTRHYGMLLQTKVKAYASKPRTGPPGPRIQTGDYVRSISLNVNRTPDGVEAAVGTNKPQGRRLEFGFVGVDAIGRHYNQPPYPHFRPALLEVQPAFLAAIAAVVATP
jgi:hypothetical protein